MQFGGYVAEDAPDPAEERFEHLRALGIPIAGFVEQPHLEDEGQPGVASAGLTGEPPDEVSVSRTYRLWRNPIDHDDPVNLAELDPALAAELDAPPSRPLPPWLLEARQRLRYPMLWEAVQTHWTRSEPDEYHDVPARLIAHVEHILHNRFREELGLGWPEWRSLVPAAALQRHPVMVDGAERDGLLVDTDPFVLGVATRLDDGRLLSAVVPRDDLPLVVLAFRSAVPIR